MTEPGQDASLVAGLQVSAAQSRNSRRASPYNIRQNRRHSTRPWSGDRQWTNDV